MNYIQYFLSLLWQRNKGFDPLKVEHQIKKDAKLGKQNWVAGDGNFGATVLKLDGQYDAFLPPFEAQSKNGIETYHCTCYGTENAIQTILKAKYGLFEEYSERYCGINGGINISYGGSPHNVAEGIRKHGMLPYNKLPFDDSIKSAQQFNSPKPLPAVLLREGEKWLDEYNFKHQWVSNLSKEGMKQALTVSPLGVGVAAWYYNSSKGVFYKPSYARDNHWVMIYGYVDGQYWKVYDSYHQEHKKLDWNYPFAFAKVYGIEKKTMSEEQQRKAGEDIYQRVKGKHIQRVEKEKGANGEMYEVRDKEIIYEWWSTDSEWMKQQLNAGLNLRKNKDYTGISEADFANLMSYAIFRGIEIVGNSSSNKLKK